MLRVDPAPAPVVDPRGGRAGMTGEVLHIFERYILIKQIGHDRDAEAVRREQIRQPDVFEPPLHHLAHGVCAVARTGQQFAFALGRTEEGSLGFLGDPGGGDILVEPGREIVTHGSRSTGTAAGLLDGELRGLAFGDAVFSSAHRSERVEGNRVTLHQGVEEMPQRSQRLVPGRCRAGEPTDVFAGQARRDLAQLKPSMVAPGEEAAGDAAIGAAGVFVAERGLEEFLGGEGGVGGLAQDDDRGGRHRQRRKRAGRWDGDQFAGLYPIGHLLDDNEQDCIRSAQTVADAEMFVELHLARYEPEHFGYNSLS
jgi:hypothetical protein